MTEQRGAPIIKAGYKNCEKEANYSGNVYLGGAPEHPMADPHWEVYVYAPDADSAYEACIQAVIAPENWPTQMDNVDVSYLTVDNPPSPDDVEVILDNDEPDEEGWNVSAEAEVVGFEAWDYYAATR